MANNQANCLMHLQDKTTRVSKNLGLVKQEFSF